MNSNGDLLREEPPGYGGASRPSAIAAYLRCLEAAHRQGNDTEHTHRPALKALLEALDPRVVATNEPKRIACGAPDLVITRKKDTLLLGHVEAKDIGVSLNEAKKSDQLKRYLPALSNLLLTDYLDFRWFVNGAERARFRLAGAKPNGELIPDLAACDHAEKVLREFLARDPVRIEGAEELAHRLARLTHLIRAGIVAAFQTGNASARTRRRGQGSRVCRHVRPNARLWFVFRARHVRLGTPIHARGSRQADSENQSVSPRLL
jgi:hypothetical protein